MSESQLEEERRIWEMVKREFCGFPQQRSTAQGQDLPNRGEWDLRRWVYWFRAGIWLSESDPSTSMLTLMFCKRTTGTSREGKEEKAKGRERPLHRPVAPFHESLVPHCLPRERKFSGKSKKQSGQLLRSPTHLFPSSQETSHQVTALEWGTPC